MGRLSPRRSTDRTVEITTYEQVAAIIFNDLTSSVASGAEAAAGTAALASAAGAAGAAVVAFAACCDVVPVTSTLCPRCALRFEPVNAYEVVAAASAGDATPLVPVVAAVPAGTTAAFVRMKPPASVPAATQPVTVTLVLPVFADVSALPVGLPCATSATALPMTSTSEHGAFQSIHADSCDNCAKNRQLFGTASGPPQNLA